MTYGLLIALLTAAVILGLVAASFLLAGAIRRDRRRAPSWAGLLGVSLLLAGGTGLALAAKVTSSLHDRVSAVRRNRAAAGERARLQSTAARERFRRKIDALNRCLEPAGAARVPPDFYTDAGFRDWWRRPLAFPYSMMNVDTFDEGYLGRYRGGEVGDPNSSQDQLRSAIRAYAFDCRFLLMRRVEDGRDRWELFEFQGGGVTRLPSEPELIVEARQRGYGGAGKLGTIRERFDEYFEP